MRIDLETVFTAPDELADEAASGRRGHLVRLSATAAACGGAYGFTMGLTHPGHPWLQAGVSSAKVPILFLLTLAICLPTLHFLGLLFGSRARFGQTITVMLVGVTATSVLLAAFAPISLFFLLSGSEYPFLLLMHVGIFAFCGAAGLLSVNRNFTRLRSQQEKAGSAAPPRLLLVGWMALYMFVGCQTAFNLSPFVGKDPAFVLLGRPNGNFYSYLWRCAQEVFPDVANSPRQ
jgi:hypothetical protein